MKKKYIVVVFFGEYNSWDFIKEHIDETHTSEEWKNLADEYEGRDHAGIFTKIYQFYTKEEMEAFKQGIEEADNYFSSEYYTVVALTERISDSANN